MKLLLIRHGATNANIDKRFQGRLDYPLCKAGKRQARLLAKRIKDMDISMIYTSGLKRAKSTADEIARYHNNKVEILPDLKEYSWGIIEGLTREEIRLKYPELASEMEKDFWGTKIPGEEGIAPFKKRLSAIYEHLIKRHINDDNIDMCENIALVTHGRVIGGMLAFITGFDFYDFPWPFVFSNASLTEVKIFNYNGDYRARIVLLNDCCHIKDVREGISY